MIGILIPVSASALAGNAKAESVATLAGVKRCIEKQSIGLQGQVFTLAIAPGAIHAIMGPDSACNSTLGSDERAR